MLIERFIEKAEPAGIQRRRAHYSRTTAPEHMRRFIKMAEARKQQILDRILMD